MTGQRSAVTVHDYNGYTYGCRCQVCTDAKAAYMRARRQAAALAARPGWVAGGEITHGTRGAYEEHGCRCGQCLAGERNSSRWNRRARKQAAT